MLQKLYKLLLNLDNNTTGNQKNNQSIGKKLSQVDQETIKNVVKSVLADSDVRTTRIYCKRKILQNTTAALSDDHGLIIHL